MKKAISAARKVCDDYLREEIRAKCEQNILPSENRVAERLLAHGDQMAHVYDEIYPKLSGDGIAWKHFLGCLLSTGAFWSTEKIAALRAGRDNLVEVNRDIAKHALALADLLDHRDTLHNTSGFSSETLYAICDVIDHASTHNGFYQSWIKEQLNQLSTRFDLKYWPSLAECARVIGEDAEQATLTPTDPLTEAATKSTRASKADFLRALLSAIDENRGDWLGAFPVKFRPSDEAMATVVNVLLELPLEELISGTYVKNLRHRGKTSKVK